ncbi:PoNe immunity protein domain-containing protein [Chitinophaga sp. Cy-1792]|uniref:PoNe immunity protein domain-containing protein n=1 Tax=Chitinophaga sp. Cy-1792 TaxID=2608339 RepID=UPI00141EC6A7|nr:PoNe immunity protein domain-containing protein [Chitinophaga sp. Cy-1792]NIG57589.1 DUF1911 domain-containing protein [Chitinophaga sp. Cy-1792]
MGFLNKLFGGSNTQEDARPAGQRAQLKNAKYFETALKERDATIAQDIQTREMMIAQGKAAPYHDWALGVDYLNKFTTLYSMGTPIDQCYGVFIQAADWYAKGWEEDSAAADMLEMISIGYLLQIPDDQFKGIVQYIAQSDAGSDYPDWQPDAILWFIIHGRLAEGPHPEGLLAPELYQSLLAITRMNKEDAAAAMKQYLENWYDLHRSDPWYDSHKRDHAYSGYWSWEAGAITKIMGLDDSSYKDNPYYPYDLVHWSKS